MLNAESLLDAIVSAYRSILGKRLVGIYLHGSLAMGCFTPQGGDIDLLAVVSEDLPFPVLRALVDVLLRHDADAPEKGIELSVLHLRDTTAFRHPLPFLMHYSTSHRERYRTQPDYLCGGFGDPDLAAHITVTRARGRCLYGRPIAEVFSPVPDSDYLSSILEDISAAETEINDNPIYHVLNLCRVLAWLREGRVLSKREGGEWALQALPEAWHGLVDTMLARYLDPTLPTEVDPATATRFADEMLHIIRRESAGR